MASNGQQDPRNPSIPPQSIPLRDLARPPDIEDIDYRDQGNTRGRSLVNGGSRPISSTSYGTRYERLEDVSPSPTERISLNTGMGAPPRIQETIDEEEYGSPIENPAAFQAAMGFPGFAGLEMGESSTGRSAMRTPNEFDLADPDIMSPYAHPYHDSNDSYFRHIEADRVPLTDPNFLQPMSGAYVPSTPGQQHDRSSFQSVRFSTPDSKYRNSRLGDDLSNTADAYNGTTRPRGRSFGDSLSPNVQPRSRSGSIAESPLSRAGSIMRAMSQRVVNLSNEQEPAELVSRRKASLNEDLPLEGLPSIHLAAVDTFYPPETLAAPVEKTLPNVSQDSPPPPKAPWPATNPFRGKSLGIFAPDNSFRIILCDLLVYPLTEIVILVLILLQTVLLTIESAPNVYTSPRSERWGASYIDYAMLALFIIFTLELAVRIIVSGFFFNAPEYSTVDKQKGAKAAFVTKYRRIFGPQRQASVKRAREGDPDAFASSFARSFTAIQNSRTEPTTLEDFQRQQLARRAFLRHSLNRIDLIAVVAFYISFILSITGIEFAKQIYVFKMLSCLRILRLLYLTNGTSIILRSLKKAAPLLVNVSFLIMFFWLLFAIIGVQGFKSSFGRQCVWIDPEGQQNYTNPFTLCGGYLDNTGAAQPWVYGNGSKGATSSKGYLCPRGSQCVEQQALYNGTVSFDNIINSLELVFVIMSANTFTDLMYYTTNSDYMPAALFFVAGIIIMMLWLTNLLIAVITSSFQVIREESKSSAFTAVEQPVQLMGQSQGLRRKSVLKHWYDKTEWIWIVIIAYGLLSQALRSASMSQDRADFIRYSELVVTILLLVEIILRFAADWRNFHRRNRNLVDTFLAVITTIILLPPIQNSGQPYAWLTIFQILRIYRVVWGVPMTRELIAKVLGNASGIGNLVLFVFLISYLVAILAAQLFRGGIPMYDPWGNVIRVTFYTIWNSFLGMYQILSSENWTAIVYNVTQFNDYLNTAWIAAVFFIGWFILSYFILINMFIAVIQENFDVSEDEKRLQQVKAFLQRRELGGAGSNLALSTIFRFGRARKTKDPLDYGQATMEMLLKDAVVKDFLDEEFDPHQENTSVDPLPANNGAATSPTGGFLSSTWTKFLTRVWNREPNPFYSSLQFSSGKEAFDPRAMAREAVSASTQRKKAQRDFLQRHPMYNTALFIFKPDNPIRRLCQKIVGPGRGSERFEGVEPEKAVWYTFSAFIYAAIVTMVVLACVATPLYQKEYFQYHDFDVKNWFVWTDMAFAAIFTVEALIKVIADGCFWTPNAYFRSLWGFIDGLVLITLWINVITSFTNDGAVTRAVGAFKALRALRLLNVSDSARETFNSVILVGGWRVISAAFVSLALLIPFAIYGVNLFNGQMMICNDNSGSIINLSDCVNEWNSTPFSNNWNVLAPRVANNPYYNFDNFGSALFILYQIVSQEGWIDVMWSAQSITARGLNPRYFASQGNAVFFVIFNLMATVFVLTLFISVFMRTYTEQTGVAFLTAEQRSWMEMRKLLRQVAPSKRSSDKNSPKWRVWCYKRAVQKHGTWHQTITIILVLHILLLMTEYYPEPYWWTRTRDSVFLVFTVFYIANTIIRIIGLTWARFRRSSWDVYALVVVSGTFITSLLLFIRPDTLTFIQLHNIFLVAITLLVIPRNNALDQLFKTAAASLTSIMNLLATWFVLFLVYAIAMTQIFGLTRFGSQETNNLNLRTVPKALILLFRMSCGEGWNQIMEDYATIQPPWCTEGDTFLDSDCGSPAGARALFISWNILSMYIFVSLFVSLIFESFSYVYQRSSGLSIITREETRRFKQAWATFDPDGTGWISKENFPRLLGELSGVFAMRIYDEEDSVRRILEDVQVHTPAVRGNSVASTSQAIGIDLKALNERISRIDARKVRQRRQRYNIFYQEVMVSADSDRGISFTTVLMILAHYNVINDNKSLKLDEYLRRRARLQRVEEEVNRRVVVGFFDTLFWHRRFRKHMDRHKSARMTDIPNFEVPEIIVDDEDGGQASRQLNSDGSPQLSATHMPDRNSAFREAFGLDGHFMFPDSGSAVSSPSRSPRLTPHRPANSAYSFDLQEPGSPHHSRHGSGVSAEGVLEVFSESAWGESLRRSFTRRRSRGGPP